MNPSSMGNMANEGRLLHEIVKRPEENHWSTQQTLSALLFFVYRRLTVNHGVRFGRRHVPKWSHHLEFPYTPLCQVLQVNCGGFNAWQRRETSILTGQKGTHRVVYIVTLCRRRDVRTMQIHPYESPTTHRLNQQCAISAKNRVRL